MGIPKACLHSFSSDVKQWIKFNCNHNMVHDSLAIVLRGIWLHRNDVVYGNKEINDKLMLSENFISLLEVLL